MTDDRETTRREALRLAAAIAAFSAALGFRQTADGAVDMFIKYGRAEHQGKFDRLELKVYDGPTLVHTCEVPLAARVEGKEYKEQRKAGAGKAGEARSVEMKYHRMLEVKLYADGNLLQ